MEESVSTNSNELEKSYRQTAIIILASFFSILALTSAPYLLTPNAEDEISAETLNTLWILIIFVAVGTFMLRRFFFRWDRLRDIALLKGVEGVLRTLKLNAIILAVLAELTLILGMAIGYWSGDWFNALRAVVIALILLAINFPRQSIWRKIVGNLQEI